MCTCVQVGPGRAAPLHTPRAYGGSTQLLDGEEGGADAEEGQLPGGATREGGEEGGDSGHFTPPLPQSTTPGRQRSGPEGGAAGGGRGRGRKGGRVTGGRGEEGEEEEEEGEEAEEEDEEGWVHAGYVGEDGADMALPNLQVREYACIRKSVCGWLCELVVLCGGVHACVLVDVCCIHVGLQNSACVLRVSVFECTRAQQEADCMKEHASQCRLHT